MVWHIPGSGSSPGGGYGNPLHYSCLKNPMDRGAQRATVHIGSHRVDTTEATQHTHKHTHTHTYTHIVGHSWLELPQWLSGIGEPTNARDECSVPGLGRSPREGSDNPLQYSCLKNPMDRGAWQATVHRVIKSQSDTTWVTEHMYIVYKHFCTIYAL